MKTSLKGFNLIKEFESLHDGNLKKIGLQPKMDPSGIWTEGWGRAMRDEKGNFLKGSANREKAERRASVSSELEADAALAQDVKPFELWIARRLKKEVTQNQFDALVSHTYNTGGSSTLIDLINSNAGKSKIYAWFTTRYISSEGVKMNGLVRRRKAEADLFYS